MKIAKTEMEELLEKTRIVSRALQNRVGKGRAEYQRMAHLLCDLSSANTYIIDREGRILGHSWIGEYDCPVMSKMLAGGKMPDNYVERLNLLRESELNHSDEGHCSYSDDVCRYSDKHGIYTPINGMGERLGTLILARFGEQFKTKDLVLAEYLGTVVGLEILNERGRNIEENARERLVVQMAMRALSFSEIESIKHILADLGGADGGVVVASRIADQAGVTRSVIVNALRKLGSAGIIESRSLGMKGTYIKITSKLFLEELGVAASPDANIANQA